MTGVAPRLFLAQVVAESRSRLRSVGTLVAVLTVLAGTYAWMPAPSKHAASLTWGSGDGRILTGIYNSAYVGTASALLASTILPLVGFYLVAGSIGRDRRSGVGAILAATPMSSLTYLAGKMLAHAAYLCVVGATSFLAGLLILIRFREGAFSPIDFLTPWVLLVPASLLVTASLAVLFDATPGLRSRGGLVLWFFLWAFGLLLVPMLHVESSSAGLPVYDPTGFAWFGSVLRDSTGADVKNLSLGLSTNEQMVRFAWAGLPMTPARVAARLAQGLWAIVPLGFALVFFDRFDPARRGGGTVRRRKEPKSEPAIAAAASVSGGDAPTASAGPRSLSPIPLRFGRLAPYFAEARLVWHQSGLLRWLLPIAALATLAPGEAMRWTAGVFLILLTPAIAEAGAREQLEGTEPLVFGLPSVPSSVTAWKATSIAIFVLALGAPMLFRAAIGSPTAAVAALAGLLFLAAWSAAAALLTGGGKLFIGTILVLWYGALSGAPFLDFCGTLAGKPSIGISAGYLLFGLAMLGLAAVREKQRKR